LGPIVRERRFPALVLEGGTRVKHQSDGTTYRARGYLRAGSPGRRWNTVVAALTVSAMTLGVTVTGPAAASATAKGNSGATVVVSNNAGELWPCNFSPYNPSANFLSGGILYEPLVFVNALQSGATTPWLASSWAWSDGNRVLSFTIRHGVRWSDGVPLGAADVVYTFDLLKRYPALDLNAVWSVLSSVSQKGSDQVTLSFKVPAVPYFYYVADKVLIVPQHIWSKIPNPVTYQDATPVGSGSYLMQHCTPENVTYVRNANYWQPGLPKIQTVEYPSYTSNGPANAALATDQANWGVQFIPSIDLYYVKRDPRYHHYWFPPTADFALIFNLKTSPLNDLQVRRAFAFAINRQRVSQIGEYGYQPPANQADIVTPTFSSWLDKPLLAKYGYGYDPKKAMAILEADGYKKGSNGIFEKNGHPLSFTVINIGGFSDWVASMNVIVQELRAVGISVTPQNLSYSTFKNDEANGNFQLCYDAGQSGPTPYYELRGWLSTANTAPIGKPAVTNFERYSDPATDKLINAYSSTVSVAAQHQIVDNLEKVMLSQVPIVPIDEAVSWYEYNDQHIGGWPSGSNPYALPGGAIPDFEVVLLHLYAK
jgi:peptide/nickel transport system substrate-binding protein